MRVQRQARTGIEASKKSIAYEENEHRMGNAQTIDIKILKSGVIVSRQLRQTRESRRAWIKCFVVYSLLCVPHVHCTGHQAGRRRNNSEKVTIRTATVITCNFNPFSANFISWEIFHCLCLISHMSRHLLVQIINPIKSETKRFYCFIILPKFYGFFEWVESE